MGNWAVYWGPGGRSGLNKDEEGARAQWNGEGFEWAVKLAEEFKETELVEAGCNIWADITEH